MNSLLAEYVDVSKQMLLFVGLPGQPDLAQNDQGLVGQKEVFFQQFVKVDELGSVEAIRYQFAVPEVDIARKF